MNVRKLTQSAVLVGALVASSAVSLKAEEKFIPMPSKLEKMKLYGDARFRYQAEEVNGADTRSRFRYRVRMGTDADFKDSGFSMGLRLETSEANDSTNNTFGGFFDKVGDGLFVGLAYLGWEGDDVEILLGKHKNPFVIDSAFWDSDINPEGISETFTAGDVTYTFGQYIISDEREDRSGHQSDAFLLAAQASFKVGEVQISPMILMTSGDFSSSRQEQGGFDGENAETYFDDFMVVQVPVSAKVAGGKVYGTVGINLDANPGTATYGGTAWTGGDEDLFFNVGYTYGSAKKPGTWEAGIEYRYIEGAAYTPNLSDSDFAKNSTNAKGFILKYTYAVTDFFTLGATYMDSDRIDDAFGGSAVANSEAQLLQLDAAIKF